MGRRILPFSKNAFGRAERALERTVGWLRGLALLELFDHLAKLGILVSVALYVYGAPDRKRQAHYAAWQVVNSAHGQRSSGGRVDALQDLARDGVPLSDLDLEGAYLESVDLRGALLVRANLQAASLTRADLASADLTRAVLSKSELGGSKMADVKMRMAVFDGACVLRADLRRAFGYQTSFKGADVFAANLEGAALHESDFTNARLSFATLRAAQLGGAVFDGASLDGADLRFADFDSRASQPALKESQILPSGKPKPEYDVSRNIFRAASIQGANIFGVRNAPAGFVEWARQNGAVEARSDEEWTRLFELRRSYSWYSSNESTTFSCRELESPILK